MITAIVDEVHKVVVEEQKVLKSQIPLTCRSLSLYLANEETEHILFRPCRVSKALVTKPSWQPSILTRAYNYMEICAGSEGTFMSS